MDHPLRRARRTAGLAGPVVSFAISCDAQAVSRVRLWMVCLVGCLAVPLSAQAGGGCPKRTKQRVHTVAKGEVLSVIASDHGVRLADLVRDNPGLDKDAVREGQELLICLPKPKAHPSCGGGRRVYEHTVHSGETLGWIAKRYAVSEAELRARNATLGQGDRLRAGQALKVCTLPQRAHGARACDYRSPLHKHVVVPGEWLAEIASRYGVRQKDIVRLNAHLQRNPDYLRTGMRISVCPEIAPHQRERLVHTVQSGQTIVSIAADYDLNPRQLIRFQEGRLKDPDRLRLGQHLIVWKDGKTVPGFGIDDEGTGTLVAGVQLPPNPHYMIKNESLAWGTAKTVRLLQQAIASYRRSSGGPKVRIGDLSRKGGGHLPPHKSHRTGEDVDVGYALKSPTEGVRFVRATRTNLDLKRTWQLLNAFLETGQVRYIFMDYDIQEWLYDYAKSRGVRQHTLDELFQYPRGKRRAAGIIRQDPGHDDHFHVRFR